MTNKIPLAIAYDFDGTLAPGNMQEHSFIPELGISKEAFWHESRDVYAPTKDMDEILAYMYLLMSKAEPNGGITRAVLEKHAHDLTFFPGVEEWFSRINTFADKLGIGNKAGLTRGFCQCFLGMSKTHSGAKNHLQTRLNQLDFKEPKRLKPESIRA